MHLFGLERQAAPRETAIDVGKWHLPEEPISVGKVRFVGLSRRAHCDL
jgi:hypothetical protein